MEARLLESLRHKLDQLERKIRAYRRDLVADFQRYYHDLLRDVASESASSVQQVIAASFVNYPTLRPHFRPRSPAFQPLPPAIVSPRADTLGIPRKREHEPQSLFTPTYLPLLDSSPALPRSTLAAAIGAMPAIPQAALLPEAGSQAVGEIQGMRMDGTRRQSSGQSNALGRCQIPPAHPISLVTFPEDGTRSIDDARSSISSDKSDSKPPRSALRRSSSMSKPPQSPRRVRFEFMGAEVLPTTSPLPSGFINPRPSSPRFDEDATFASNLGGDSAEEDKAPPRKVSSSDALRALSRTPLEEGAVWTVVNTDADEVAPDQPDAPEQLDSVPGVPPSSAAESRMIADSSEGGQRGPCGKSIDKELVDDRYDVDSSDDGFLAMAQPRSSGKKSLQPAATTTPRSQVESAHDSVKSSTGPTNSRTSDSSTAREENSPILSESDGEAEAEEDEELFYFEATGSSAPPRPRPRPRPRPTLRGEDSEEPASSDDESYTRTAEALESRLNMYATSPAIPIRQSLDSQPSTTTNVKFQPGSLGSYKGRHLMMPIVRDPKVLAQAILGVPDMPTTSGNDQTAMNDGSPSRVPSTPLSFKERFMMEELMEQAQSNKDKKNKANR